MRACCSWKPGCAESVSAILFSNRFAGMRSLNEPSEVDVESTSFRMYGDVRDISKVSPDEFDKKAPPVPVLWHARHWPWSESFCAIIVLLLWPYVASHVVRCMHAPKRVSASDNDAGW